MFPRQFEHCPELLSQIGKSSGFKTDSDRSQVLRSSLTPHHSPPPIYTTTPLMGTTGGEWFSFYNPPSPRPLFPRFVESCRMGGILSRKAEEGRSLHFAKLSALRMCWAKSCFTAASSRSSSQSTSVKPALAANDSKAFSFPHRTCTSAGATPYVNMASSTAVNRRAESLYSAGKTLDASDLSHEEDHEASDCDSSQIDEHVRACSFAAPSGGLLFSRASDCQQ